MAAAGAAAALLGSLVVGGATTASADDAALQFVCTFDDWDLDYAPTASLAQNGTGVTLTMGDFPAIEGVPSFVTVSNVKSSVTASVGGRTVALGGAHGVNPATPMGNGFKVPPMSATLPTGLPASTLGVTGLTFTVTAVGAENEIACQVVQGGAFSVAATAVPKVASQATAKVKVVKKKRVATATVQVKGKAGVATGKVSLTVTKGKKTVKKKTVTLNKRGVAVTKLGKLKKGRYALKVTYAGDKAYMASSKKVAFRVR